jgi:hypothetical protein
MLTRFIGTFMVGVLVVGCAIFSPHQPKESRQQLVPKELLNSQWTLETFQGKAPGCNVLIHFLEKGQLTFTIQDEIFKGKYLYYIVKESSIHFHTRHMDKIAWPNITCQPAPDHFARILSWGDKKYRIMGDQLFLYTNERLDLVFKKI